MPRHEILRCRLLAPQGRQGDQRHGFLQLRVETSIDGGWYRCCGGTVRKLTDCCSRSNRRINGDAALEGYCYQGRKVFCVMYYQTKVPC